MINFFFPLLNLVDNCLWALLPDFLEFAFWGGFCGIAVPLTYRWLSNQKEIARLKKTSRDIRRKLFQEDLHFSEYLALSMQNLRTATRLFLKVGVPALAGAVFAIVTISWLGVFHHYSAPEIGQNITVRIYPPSKNVSVVPAGSRGIDGKSIRLAITKNTFPLTIRYNDRIIFEGDPTKPPTAEIYQRQWWRIFLKNEAGYIHDASPIEKVHFGFARKRTTSCLPLWMSTWEFPFFVCFFIMSIIIMRGFRIQ